MSKGEFSAVLQAAQDQAWSPFAIKAAFRATATHPCDMSVIKEKHLVKKKKLVNTLLHLSLAAVPDIDNVPLV